jgi:hypothetical protein
VYGQISALHGLAWLYGLTEQRDANRAAVWLEDGQRLWGSAEMRAARVDLALALSDSGFHSEAVQHMEAVVAETPSAGAIGNLGWVFYQAGITTAASRRVIVHLTSILRRPGLSEILAMPILPKAFRTTPNGSTDARFRTERWRELY